jgi:hypothetical protein
MINKINKIIDIKEIIIKYTGIVTDFITLHLFMCRFNSLIANYRYYKYKKAQKQNDKIIQQYQLISFK